MLKTTKVRRGLISNTITAKQNNVKLVLCMVFFYINHFIFLSEWLCETLARKCINWNHYAMLGGMWNGVAATENSTAAPQKC